MINQTLLLAGDDAYNLSKSLRLRSSASAYLNRTPASAGNRKTWTYSTWLKRGAVGAEGTIISGGATAGRLCVYINSSGQLVSDVGGTGTFDQSTAVYRDPSAWYHFVWQFDTTQATGANRSRMYINGVQVTLTNTRTFTQNADYEINNSVLQTLGTFSNSIGTYNFDGYQAETNFIDGQALTPSSFGSTNALTGVWQPAKYTGTYGTNGFYLPFSDNASTTTLGYDFSGNSNNWTTSNISLTAGTTYDSMTDVPTLTSATTANYCVMNPLTPTSVRGSITNGNLTVTSAANNFFAPSTAFVNSGKWYAEYTISSGANAIVGIMPSACNPRSSSYFANGAGDGTGINDNNAGAGGAFRIFNYANNGSVDTLTGQTYVSGDVIGIAMDLDSGILNFYRNGAIITTGRANNNAVSYTLSSISPYWAFACGNDATYTINLNFGQQGFTYTPPTGFVALNTFNLPEPSIKSGNKQMNVLTYSGDGANGRNITGFGFSPEFLWIKKRSGAEDHKLNDIVRGVDKQLMSNRTEPEYNSTDQVRAFLSDGFTTDNSGSTNGSGQTYVAWAWKANGTGVSNTAGSITSTVSVNPTAGFSVVTYTGSGAAGTVGHGLGVAPAMIITKNRTTAGNAWVTWQKAMPNAFSSSTAYMYLDQTAAAGTTTNFYDGTAMTSSTFRWQTGNININSTSNNYVAYCWSEIAGFSKFGSYTGNGSTDGTFVYTGFRPKFVMIKRTDNVGDWYMLDTSRDPYNLVTQKLMADLSVAENGNGESTSTNTLDILSNGFKMRSTNTASNTSGGTYIYMAFAESPFKNSLAR